LQKRKFIHTFPPSKSVSLALLSRPISLWRTLCSLRRKFFGRFLHVCICCSACCCCLYIFTYAYTYCSL